MCSVSLLEQVDGIKSCFKTVEKPRMISASGVSEQGELAGCRSRAEAQRLHEWSCTCFRDLST